MFWFLLVYVGLGGGWCLKISWCVCFGSFRLPPFSALGSLGEEDGGDRVLAEEEPPHVAESPPRCAPSLGNLRCCGRAGVNTAEPFLKGWRFPPTQNS